MAYVKISNIKTGTHLQQAISYIKNSDKTDNGILISSYMCSADYAGSEFKNVTQFAMRKGNNIAIHICQSFSPEDNITPQQAHKIGQEFIKRLYPNYQYVLATHIDRLHIHNHFILNSVDMKEHKKFRNNISNLKIML